MASRREVSKGCIVGHYSKNETINDIVGELVDRGFDFKKGGSHGKLFAPNRYFVVAVPSTPSDWRAEKNFRGDVRRFLRTHNYESLQEDQKHEEKERKMFNPPVIRDVTPEPITKVKEVKAKVKAAKTIRDVDPEHVIAMHKNGTTYDGIASVLTEQGYTLVYGGVIRGSNLAGWLAKYGYQPNLAKYEKWQKRKSTVSETRALVAPEPPPPPPVPQLPQQKLHPLLSDVMEIVSSNLTDDLKESFLKMIVQKHGG